MANGEENSGGFSPLWYAVAAIVLILAMMAALMTFKPLDFKPPAAAAGEHEAAPATGEPEGTSRAAPAPAHEEH
jgi:hypothetical protein